MVEGPGATRNGRKVQGVVGLVLLEMIVTATTAAATEAHRTPSSTAAKQKNNKAAAVANLEGRKLESAFSVGKEVFLVFGPAAIILSSSSSSLDHSSPPPSSSSESDEKPIALRFHFGMNGSLTVRKANESTKVAPWRTKDKSISKCTLKFGSNTATCSGVTTTTTTTIVETVASTWTVISAVVAQSKLDRLYKQDVCAPPHNFDPQAVQAAIFAKRSTSMICDAILDQERFPGVGNIIKIEGLHKANVHPRRIVQDLSLEELERTIMECRSYAMGWLSNGRAPLKHVYNRTKCGTCKIGRVRMVKLGNDLNRVTFWCESCQPFSLIATTTTNSLGSSSNNNINDSNDSSKIIGSFQKTTKSSSVSPLLVSPPPKSGCCPQHGTKTILLRRVRKMDSNNLHRLFYTCIVKGCPYFDFADKHLPFCRCPPNKKKKTILRVSKTERTGGRWFLSCGAGATTPTNNNNAMAAANRYYQQQRSGGTLKKSNGRSGGCSFFQWATTSQLAPFGDDLSPLT